MLGFLRRTFGLPLRSVAFDAALSAFVVAGSLIPLAANHDPRGYLAWVMALALLVRRRWPVPVYVVVGLCGATQVLTHDMVEAYDVAVLIAMYTVVKYADRMLWGWAVGLSVLLGAAWYGVAGPDGVGLGGRVWYVRGGMIVAYAVPVWLIGLTMRTRRLYVRSLEDRASTAERERDQRARLAVAEERGRMARELHDVVAHSLAVMIVQADGASYAIDTDPGKAKRAVRTVADTGREALTDMRRLVSVLRGTDPQQAGSPLTATDTDPAEVGADERRSVGLGRLEPLLDRFRAAGLRIELHRSGPVRALPGGIELAGYRIVQESLTNVLKHAGAGTGTTVSVTYHEDRVELSVLDDGTGDGRFVAEPLPGGHGLLGMRERVEVYQGRFAAGPRVGPGWRVTASIPVPAAIAEPPAGDAGVEPAATVEATAEPPATSVPAGAVSTGTVSPDAPADSRSREGGGG